MNEVERRRLVLSAEGQFISYAAERSSDAGEIMRAHIDGVMNAMARIEGHSAAAEYAFALSDRLVGKMPLATIFPPKPAVIEGVQTETRAAAAPKPMRFWKIFVVAWLFGFWTGVSVR